MIRSFLDLEVYQESLILAKDINILVRGFPASEKHLLVDQMSRNSRGIPSLIAESWAKRYQVKEFIKYLRDAIGEANEMMSHLEQSRIFKLVEDEKAKALIQKYDYLAGKLNRLKENWKSFS
mgnify:CR=1 FL=1